MVCLSNDMHFTVLSVGFLLLSFVASFVSRVAIVSPSDPISVAAKKMREYRVNSVIIMTGSKIQGILTYYSFLYWLLSFLTVTLYQQGFIFALAAFQEVFWCLFISTGGYLCLFVSTNLQFKGYSYAGCGTKPFSWVDSGGKGCCCETTVV